MERFILVSPTVPVVVELDCFLSVLKMLSPWTMGGGKKACPDFKLAPVCLSAASVPLWWWDSWRLNSSAANLKLFNISVIILQPEAAVARVWKQSVSSQTTTLPANQYRQSSCLTFRTASKLQKNQTSSVQPRAIRAKMQ